MVRPYQIPPFIIEVILMPIFFLIAFCRRFRRKPIDVGLGPEPLINNLYHKKALGHYGYSAETFVADVYFITDKSDVRGDKIFYSKFRYLKSPSSTWSISICSSSHFSGISACSFISPVVPWGLLPCSCGE
jgi:hypothetical protein